MVFDLIINVHAHLARKELYSDKWWDAVADQMSMSLNINKKIIIEQNLSDYFNSEIHHAKAFVKVLDDSGVDKAIICGMDFGLSTAGESSWSIEEINEWLANQAKKFSNKLYALCTIDPRRKNAIRILERAVSKEMIGVKFHPTAGFFPNAPSFFPFYKKCTELKIPIFSHCSSFSTPLMDSQYADPVYLDGVASKFPHLKIVMIHFGGLSWMLKCAEIMCSRLNVFAEISTNQIAAKGMPEYFLKTLRGVMDLTPHFGRPISERIMFGTDWPYFSRTMEDKDWVKWVEKIPETAEKYGLKFKNKEIKQILGLNARKILNL